MRLSMNVKRNMLKEQEESGEGGAENYHTKENSGHSASNTNKTGMGQAQGAMARQP